VERNLIQRNQAVKFLHLITVTVSCKLECAEIHY